MFTGRPSRETLGVSLGSHRVRAAYGRRPRPAVLGPGASRSHDGDSEPSRGGVTGRSLSRSVLVWSRSTLGPAGSSHRNATRPRSPPLLDTHLFNGITSSLCNRPTRRLGLSLLVDQVGL
jgi:hypothetical protein